MRSMSRIKCQEVSCKLLRSTTREVTSDYRAQGQSIQVERQKIFCQGKGVKNSNQCQCQLEFCKNIETLSFSVSHNNNESLMCWFFLQLHYLSYPTIHAVWCAQDSLKSIAVIHTTWVSILLVQTTWYTPRHSSPASPACSYWTRSSLSQL